MLREGGGIPRFGREACRWSRLRLAGGLLLFEVELVDILGVSHFLEGSNSRTQLFTKPFVRRFICESRMPRHEIRKGFDLTRRFHDAHTRHGRSHLCQPARHGENQVRLCDGKDRGDKEWQCERDVPLYAKLQQSAIHQSLFPFP